MKLEYWAEEKAFKLENEAVKRDFTDVKVELDKVKAPNFYQRHLLESINQQLGKRDIEAVNSLHHYFDYNLNFIDRSNPSKPCHVVKVHQPELNLAGLQLRLGHIDQALLSVLETIKISQNKNDHEAII